MSGPDCGGAGRAPVRLRPGRHCGNTKTWQASREEEVGMQQMLRVAIYARVSSDQQSGDNTIVSQITALQARVSADGLVLPAAQRFVDDGYSGATLARPALEQLRDLAAAGALDRVYVHSPDRLARRYAYQVLLVDELHRAGVEIVFLNRPIGTSAEDDLLLQVQGMVAEYERAQIMERSRRGKRYAALAGSVNVLVAAPYGYRYIKSKTAVELRGTRSSRNRRRWFDRSSAGSVTT